MIIHLETLSRIWVSCPLRASLRFIITRSETPSDLTYYLVCIKCKLVIICWTSCYIYINGSQYYREKYGPSATLLSTYPWLWNVDHEHFVNVSPWRRFRNGTRARTAARRCNTGFKTLTVSRKTHTWYDPCSYVLISAQCSWLSFAFRCKFDPLSWPGFPCLRADLVAGTTAWHEACYAQTWWLANLLNRGTTEHDGNIFCVFAVFIPTMCVLLNVHIVQ